MNKLVSVAIAPRLTLTGCAGFWAANKFKLNTMYTQQAKVFNQLCAEFLGYDLTKIVDEMPLNKKGEYCNGNGDIDANGNRCNFIYSHSIFKFDYDWNSLMKVVDAIENIEVKNSFTNSFSVIITGATCEIKCRNFDMKMPTIIKCGKSKIDATTQAINDFLWWYKTSFKSKLK